MNRSLRNAFLAALFSCAVFLLFVLPFLHYPLVFQMSEAREGAVVQKILETGEIILPRRHGGAIPSKPILFHWIGAAIAKLRGTFDEAGLRAPSALSAAALVGLMAFVVSEAAGVGSTIFCTFVMLTMYGFVRLASDGRVDMTFTLFSCSTILLWLIEAREYLGDSLAKIPPQIYMLIGLCAGLSVLTKGPLGVVMPYLIIFCLAVLHSGLSGVRSFFRFAALPAAFLPILIAGPWYLMATLRGSDAFLTRQLFFENVNRFVGGQGITVKPFWFYLEFFWAHAAPWSLVFLLYGALLIRKRLRPAAARTALLPEDPGQRFYWKSGFVWFLVTIVFLSLSAGKRRAYLLPTLPAVALLLSMAYAQAEATIDRAELQERLFSPGVRRAGRAIWYALVLLFLLVLLTGFICELFGQGSPNRLLVYLRSLPPSLWRDPFTPAAFGSVLLLGTIIFWKRSAKAKSLRLLAFSVISFALFLSYVPANVLLGAKGITHSYKNFSLEVASRVPADVELIVIKKALDESFDTILFYYPQRIDVRNPTSALEPGRYYLAHRRWFDEQQESMLRASEKMYEGGRLADTPERYRVLFRYLPMEGADAPVPEAPAAGPESFQPLGEEKPGEDVFK